MGNMGDNYPALGLIKYLWILQSLFDGGELFIF